LTPIEKTYGLVLAGGHSKRMGHDKALIRVDGETQLGRAVRLLESFVDRVFVSTRVDQQEEVERRKYCQIIDQYENLGPIAGILSALQEHSDVGWLVLACDLPNIDETTIRFLLANKSADRPFSAFTSTSDGLPEPLCAYYAAGTGSTIKAFIDDGIICPRKVLSRSDTHLLDQPNPAALDNINTPEDLARTGLKVAL
jgi:molybdopterin-guanine dinucleotide biosynthesis protein A